MSCNDVPRRECLEWHIYPHTEAPKWNATRDSLRVRCPAHDDSEPSLVFSVVNDQLKYNCFACKNRQKVRLALIRAGVPPSCLPFTAAEKEDILDQLYRILTADIADHGNVRLRAAAALEGFRDLPGGSELDRIAALAHVHRATAYRARKSPLPPFNR